MSRDFGKEVKGTGKERIEAWARGVRDGWKAGATVTCRGQVLSEN